MTDPQPLPWWSGGLYVVTAVMFALLALLLIWPHVRRRIGLPAVRAGLGSVLVLAAAAILTVALMAVFRAPSP